MRVKLHQGPQGTTLFTGACFVAEELPGGRIEVRSLVNGQVVKIKAGRDADDFKDQLEHSPWPEDLCEDVFKLALERGRL